jgi:hypothetical protein
MTPSRTEFINDYLQRESVGLTKIYGKNAFIGNLIEMSDQQKERLFNIIEELKSRGSNEPLSWGIQDVDPDEDYGGSAYYLFIKSLVEIYKNPEAILAEIYDDKFYKQIQETNAFGFRQDFNYFLETYGFEIVLKIVDVIARKNNSVKQTENLRSWKLIATDKNGNQITEIKDLELFRESDEFDF